MERMALFALKAIPMKKIKDSDLELAASIVETIIAFEDSKYATKKKYSNI